MFFFSFLTIKILNADFWACSGLPFGVHRRVSVCTGVQLMSTGVAWPCSPPEWEATLPIWVDTAVRVTRAACCLVLAE